MTSHPSMTCVRVDVDGDLWRRLRVKAILDGKKLTDLLNEAIRQYLEMDKPKK